MDVSDKDKRLLEQLGLSVEQVERDSHRVESETLPDGLTGRVYQKLHFELDSIDSQS